jgi:hypothetical protein
MSDCGICDGTSLEAIDAALNEKRLLPEAIVRRFCLNPDVLRWHIAHRAQEELTRRSVDGRKDVKSVE